MRALVLEDRQPRLVTSRPEPECGPEEVVVRPRRVAVDALDLAVCQGLFDFQGVLGHQFVGVVETGNGSARNGSGKPQRVVGSMHVVCGDCTMCRAGLPAHCRNRTILGLDRRDGCLTDRFSIPEVNLVEVPDALDDDRAVFAAPLASALQAARQLTIEGKPYITVLGDGPLGLLTAQVMVRLNASVRVVGASPEKLATCEKWGIKHRHVDDVGRRADQDVVVDCTGDPSGLSLAMRLVRPRGKIVLKTLSAPSRAEAIDLSPLVINEIELLGSFSGPLAEAVSLLSSGEIDVVSLISRRKRLDDGPDILRAAADQDTIAVVVDV